MEENDSQGEYIRSFALAFYEDRWVAIPIFYIPRAAYDPASGELRRQWFEILEGGPVTPLKKRDGAVARDKKWVSVKESLVPWLMPDEEVKEVCKKNDIPIGWVTKKKRNAPKTRSKIIRRLDDEKRKNIPLTIEDYKALRKELRKISEQSALICEILWYVNTVFKNGGAYITLEEVVRLQVEDVAPDEGDNYRNWVDFSRYIPSGMHMLSTDFPSHLWKALCRQIKEDSIFVFSTGKGTPLLPMQVDKHIKAAARKASIKRAVTSLSFRPSFSEEIAKIAQKNQVDAEVKLYLEPVSEKEWELLCNEISELREKRGRKHTHDPRQILNAILQHMREKRSWAKRSLSSVPAEAVKSQKRRWRHSGILDRIFAFRKSRPSS